MKDVVYIQSTDFKDIIPKLKRFSPKGAHFTNGTYAFDHTLIVPTTLTGFKRVTKTQAHLPLVIAVNSDISMKSLNKTGFEDQKTRAQKVAEPLKTLFPKNQVIVVYYDDKTPFNLYQALHTHHLTRTLHKWGYGTAKDAPKIEGADYFEFTYGFPLPNDEKPLCYGDTDIAENPQNIIVDDLRDKMINSNNKILFPLPKALQHYGEKQRPTCQCTLS